MTTAGTTIAVVSAKLPGDWTRAGPNVSSAARTTDRARAPHAAAAAGRAGPCRVSAPVMATA
jgi:hypothetical protein